MTLLHACKRKRKTIGLKNSRHFFIQSGVKSKPIVTRSHAFYRALRQLHVITLSFDWFTVLSVSFVIGQSDYFGFGFTYNTKLKTALAQTTANQLAIYKRARRFELGATEKQILVVGRTGLEPSESNSLTTRPLCLLETKRVFTDIL